MINQSIEMNRSLMTLIDAKIKNITIYNLFLKEEEDDNPKSSHPHHQC